MASNERHSMKTEHMTMMLPFIPTIMEAYIYDQFLLPIFRMYDGSTDPKEHLKMFINWMEFHATSDAI